MMSHIAIRSPFCRSTPCWPVHTGSCRSGLVGI